MTVTIGLGLHRPMTDAELAPLAPFAPLQSDPDDVVSTADVDGIPGQLFRPMARCDAILSVGIAELHQYAGISGGHKGASVGCGGRATIAALHHRDRVLAPGIELGRLEGNPFRAAVDALGEAAGCRFALLYVPATEEWLFGDPVAVTQAALPRLNPWRWVTERAPGARLSVPTAKAASLYQASRAATYLALSPNPPLKAGAVLCIEAACPEGLGAEAGFRAALQAHRPPWQALLDGPPPEGAGAQRAVMMALMARRYPLQIVGCADPAAFQAIGIDAKEEVPPLHDRWLPIASPFHILPQLRSTSPI